MEKNILLVGAGLMAKEYFRVLSDQKIPVTVIGNSEAKAKDFSDSFHVDVHIGGLESFLKKRAQGLNEFTHAIVTVGEDQAPHCVELLVQNGLKEILLEKPGAVSVQDFRELAKKIPQEAHVFIAYNRRFYSSVQEILRLTNGGAEITSVTFEFTEWSDSIAKLNKKASMKESWLFLNSTHVIDLAFFLGGGVETLTSFKKGSLDWHSKASRFAGAGLSSEGVCYSYSANWDAPGRWGVEVLTKNQKYILRPLEELRIQKRNSIDFEKVDVPLADIDKKFKPGLQLQVESFLGDRRYLKTLQDQLIACDLYETILEGGTYDRSRTQKPQPSKKLPVEEKPMEESRSPNTETSVNHDILTGDVGRSI